MKIELSKNELLFDMMNKSHSEVSVITDAEARYKVEAGTEKKDELERDLITALSMLNPHISRYLVSDFTEDADNEAALPDTIVFEFSFAERRLDGKMQPLTDAIHAFLVDCTLGLFYASVAHTEFQTKRTQMAAADAQLVEQLIYTKRPPYMTRS